MDKEWVGHSENCLGDERFIERVGQQFEVDGFSRIAGRILGYLLLQREPQSLDALAEALRVSKASVSSNTRLLEGIGALERVTHPGDRRDYYQIAEHLHDHMIELRLRWFRRTLDLLNIGLQTEAACDPVIRSRFEGMTRFFEQMLADMQETHERWQREHGEVIG